MDSVTIERIRQATKDRLEPTGYTNRVIEVLHAAAELDPPVESMTRLELQQVLQIPGAKVVRRLLTGGSVMGLVRRSPEKRDAVTCFGDPAKVYFYSLVRPEHKT